jgi:ketosteroid isomerase-like protein
MSEQANLEIVQRGYKAFAEGDMAALLKLLADDVEWNFPPSYAGIPWSQHPWRGPDGVLQGLKLLYEFLEFKIFQPDEYIAGKDSMVVLRMNDAGSRQLGASSKRSGHKSSLCATARSANIEKRQRRGIPVTPAPE